VAIPAVALGILVGTMIVRAARIATRTPVVRRLAPPASAVRSTPKI
jgi:hypothetical protein